MQINTATKSYKVIKPEQQLSFKLPLGKNLKLVGKTRGTSDSASIPTLDLQDVVKLTNNIFSDKYDSIQAPSG